MRNLVTVEFEDDTGKVSGKLLQNIIETVENNGGTLLKYERKDNVPQEVKVIGTLRGV